jgi:hypothetical protein
MSIAAKNTVAIAAMSGEGRILLLAFETTNL